MKISRTYSNALIAFACLLMGAAFAAPSAVAQDSAWQLLRADYGYRDQRTDVTKLVRDLISRGGVNGRISVNNQTMGGDPAVGKDKSLRIFATDARNQQREFDYPEGGFFPAAMFVSQNMDRRDPDRDERWSDRDRFHDGDDRRDHGDARDLSISKGFYGVQGRTVDVTDLLQRMVRNRSLSVPVNNRAMGGDPAIGADKVLIVIYRTQGKEQAAAVPEGSTLTLP